MANTTIEPNMNLILPTPGVQFGPQYAADQNQDLLIIGSHNHSPGSGVPVTPSGLDISTNLNFQNNSPYNVYSVIFSASASNSNILTLYTAPQSGGGINDLFFNDGAGNIIALTKAGEVNATIASLPGESYAGGTFTWVQGDGSTTPANFDIGSITIRPNTAGTTNGVVLGPPSAISSQFNVQLPVVPASVTGIMQIDTSGNMLSSLVPDNSTITIASQILKVPDGGITRIQEAAVGQQISSSCGVFSSSVVGFVQITNLSITITTTGRPVMIAITSDGTTSVGSTGITPSSGTLTRSADLAIFRDASQISTNTYTTVAGIADILPPPGFMYLDTPGAGTYNYTAQVATATTSVVFGMSNCVLVVYEL